MKIAVAQFYTENVKYGPYAEKINSAYCESKNYTYFIEKDNSKIYNAIGDDRTPHWYKPIMLLEVFEKTQADWVLFLDIDAIVCDFDRDIEEFIDDNYNIIASDDVGHHSDFNTGVLLLKNNQKVKDFLKVWYDSGATYTGNDAKELQIGTLHETHRDVVGVFKTALWWDQTPFTLLSRKPEYKGFIKTVDRHYFNHWELEEHNFIFHGYAKGHHPYRTLDLAYKKLFPENRDDLENRNIIVYHIFCTGGYLDTVSQQLNRIKNSGMYDWCDIFHINCISLDGEFENVEKLLENYPKAKLHKFKNNSYEFEAITAVWNYAQEYNGNVFYLHTKGVSNTYRTYIDKEYSERKDIGQTTWRNLMEYFLVDNYKICLEKLKEADQVGVTNIRGWWSGNFWWSTLESISKQTEPHPGDRWMYEAWINRDRNPSKHEFYHYTWNPYYTTLPLEFYKGELTGDVEIVKAEYGTLGMQQDEGQPDLPRKTKDVTQIVRENLLQNNNKAIDLHVNVGTMKCDPFPHVLKYLEIVLQIQGKQYFLTTNDNTHLNIKF